MGERVTIDLPDDVAEWLLLNSNGLARSNFILKIVRAHIESQKMFKGLPEEEWRSVHEDAIKRAAASPKEAKDQSQ